MTQWYESHGTKLGAVKQDLCDNKEDHQPHQWYIYGTEEWDKDPYTGNYQSWGPYFCPGVNPNWEFKKSVLYYIGGMFFIKTKDGWLKLTGFTDAQYSDREMTALMEDGRLKEL